MKANRPSTVFLRVFLEHRDKLENLLFRRTGCRADAADLVQDLFLRMWSRPLAEPENAAGYLFRSAHNLAIDHRRATGLRAEAISCSYAHQCGVSASPDQSYEARVDLAAVENALRRLPERARLVFLLNRMHGRTYSDIARALDVSVSTVEKDMMRALAACKASLHEPKQPS